MILHHVQIMQKSGELKMFMATSFANYNYNQIQAENCRSNGKSNAKCLIFPTANMMDDQSCVNDHLKESDFCKQASESIVSYFSKRKGSRLGMRVLAANADNLHCKLHWT